MVPPLSTNRLSFRVFLLLLPVVLALIVSSNGETLRGQVIDRLNAEALKDLQETLLPGQSKDGSCTYGNFESLSYVLEDCKPLLDPALDYVEKDANTNTASETNASLIQTGSAFLLQAPAGDGKCGFSDAVVLGQWMEACGSFTVDVVEKYVVKPVKDSLKFLFDEYVAFKKGDAQRKELGIMCCRYSVAHMCGLFDDRFYLVERGGSSYCCPNASANCEAAKCHLEGWLPCGYGWRGYPNQVVFDGQKYCCPEGTKTMTYSNLP